MVVLWRVETCGFPRRPPFPFRCVHSAALGLPAGRAGLPARQPPCTEKRRWRRHARHVRMRGDAAVRASGCEQGAPVHGDSHVCAMSVRSGRARRCGRRRGRHPVRHGDDHASRGSFRAGRHPRCIGPAPPLASDPASRRVRVAFDRRRGGSRRDARQCRTHGVADRRAAGADRAPGRRAARPRGRPFDRARRAAGSRRRARPAGRRPPRRARGHLGLVLRRALLPRHAVQASAGRGGDRPAQEPVRRHARKPLLGRRSRRAAQLGVRDRRVRGASHAEPGCLCGPSPQSRRRRAGLLSFDIDVMDPSVAPGTGTPEVAGLQPQEALAFLRALRGLRFTGYDIVEVSPPYDGPGQTTALLAANIGYELLRCRRSSSRACRTSPRRRRGRPRARPTRSPWSP